MLEKAKTFLLVFLILLSMVLTYRLWFGGPYLEEVTLPRYEYAFFTPPPELSEIIKPSEILYREEEKDALLYYRGQEGYEELWEVLLESMKESFLVNDLQDISQEEKNTVLAEASEQLLLNFSPSLPLEFIVPDRTYWEFLEVDIIKVVMAENEGSWQLFLRTKEDILLSSSLQLEEQFREKLSPAEGFLYTQLPDIILLDLAAGCEERLRQQIEKQQDLAADQVEDVQREDVQDEDSENNETEPEAEDILEEKNGELLEEEEEREIESEGDEAGQEDEEESEEDFQEEEQPTLLLEIETGGRIFVPKEQLWGAEAALEKEDIPWEELVRAFFFDLSMARRIEERDGALFFTDGEKGLRIYPSGLVEYAAPMLERGLSAISYSAALQKGAENQSLYGGWLEESYLVDSWRTDRGYRLIWRPVFNGLPLEGNGCGSEMLVNEQGVPFYSRNFLVVTRNNKERRPFRPYEEALCKALSLYEDHFEEQRATLLTFKPVLYVSGKEEEKRAIPAWKVHFEETGAIYLHWINLEELS